MIYGYFSHLNRNHKPSVYFPKYLDFLKLALSQYFAGQDLVEFTQ